MQHVTARAAIDLALRGSALGPLCQAVVWAGVLDESPWRDAPLRPAVTALAASCPPDQGTAAAAVPSTAAQLQVPADQAALVAQCAPLLHAQPATLIRDLVALWCLTELWPHVASSERPALRARFLATLAQPAEPDAAFIPSSELRAWTRELATLHGEAKPSVASLRRLVDAPTARDAFRIFADHVGSALDLAALSYGLGTLTVQLLLHRHDPDQRASDLLLATIASQRLAQWLPPDLHAAAATQLAHALWQYGQPGRLPAVLICLDDTTPPLSAALTTGDMVLAQRAARVAVGSQQPARFWHPVLNHLAHALADRDVSCLRLITLAAAFSWRTGANPIAPDDAAALAGLLTAANRIAAPV